MALVFVYGALKRGGKNNHKLLCSDFIGEGETMPVFEMMNLGSDPGVVKGTNKICGEVFEVDSNTLHELDKLERLGWVYEREQTFVYIAGVRLVCWIYIYKHTFLAWILDSIFRSNFNVHSYNHIDRWKNCP